jgi:hypothetical protein
MASKFLVSRMHLEQISQQKTNYSREKWAVTMKKEFTEEKTQMDGKICKIVCLTGSQRDTIKTINTIL